MSGAALSVLSSGLVTGLGATAAESCAAIRCGVNNFIETRFVAGGDWLVGSAVPLEEIGRGASRLAHMAALALQECLAEASAPPSDIPILVCVAEAQRPGRLQGLDTRLIAEVGDLLGHPLHPATRIVPHGRIGGAIALRNARTLIGAGHRRVAVLGVDSFLMAGTIAGYERAGRLLTRSTSNGFVPGEAAGALLLAAADPQEPGDLVVDGLGFAREPAPFGSGEPLRAEGLVQAIRMALAEAGRGIEACDHRISDANGEPYGFKEAALAVTRVLRARKDLFDLWHLADCIGEVGAATLPAMLAVLLAGARGDYLPGPVFLGHLGTDDGKRAAFVARATTQQSLALEAAAIQAAEARAERARAP
jgi:3-oxoacyl-[acyl-carrier-protein] synthase-1